MKFKVSKSSYNLLNTMRRLGYHPHRANESFARRLGSGQFPRLHAYLRDVDSEWEFSIHLDQKGACYGGQTAHSGDYDGEILNNEKERIIKSLA